jgi:hypothetical protein
MPSYIYNMVDTWNAGATTFTAIKMNVTDTASAAGSLLMDLQVGGSSKFNVTKAGTTTFSGNLQIANNGVYLEGTTVGTIRIPGVGGYYGWTTNTASTPASTIDLFLTRKAAASLRLGVADAASPVAQTLGVQSVVAGTTNTAGANFTIAGSQGTGTGAGGSIIFQVAPAGSSGTAQNALQNTFMVASGEARVINTLGTSGNLNISSTANTNVTTTFRFQTGTDGTGGTNAGFVGRISGNFGVHSAGGTLIVGQPSGSTDSISIWGTDVLLARDAANTLTLRNGANAQAFRVYNTYTDASNYERAELSWVSNVARWQSTAVGGTVRNMEIVRGSTTHWLFSVNGSYFGAHLLAGTDNLYDIGASSASRPRSIYTSSGVVFANSLAVNSSTFNAVLWNSGQFGWGSSATVTTSTNTDTGLKRSAAAVVAVTDGSTGGGSVELQEMTAPAAPAANNVRIYAEDDGAGKTRLMARFATGAAVQIAIEP